jgi:hypothetical protein
MADKTKPVSVRFTLPEIEQLLEKESKLPKRERRSTQRLFEELRGRGYDGAHDLSLRHRRDRQYQLAVQESELIEPPPDPIPSLTHVGAQAPPATAAARS